MPIYMALSLDSSCSAQTIPTPTRPNGRGPRRGMALRRADVQPHDCTPQPDRGPRCRACRHAASSSGARIHWGRSAVPYYRIVQRERCVADHRSSRCEHCPRYRRWRPGGAAPTGLLTLGVLPDNTHGPFQGAVCARRSRSVIVLAVGAGCDKPDARLFLREIVMLSCPLGVEATGQC